MAAIGHCRPSSEMYRNHLIEKRIIGTGASSGLYQPVFLNKDYLPLQLMETLETSGATQLKEWHGAQWRRKFDDLEDLQRQAQENPVRGKGRSRWAPAKKENGVGKGERGRWDKKFTAIAQVAIVNAAWESKLVRLESEARDYMARAADQFRSLHDAASPPRSAVRAHSNESTYLRQQIQIQASPGIPHKLMSRRLGSKT